MQTAAIQQDVSTDVPGVNAVNQGAVTGSDAVLSPREEAMRAITQKTLEREIAAGYDPADAAPVPPKLPEVLADEQLAEVKVKVKVDGVEVEMPLSDVTKGYQKDAVASKRLAVAAAERKKLEAWEQELRTREATLVLGDTLSSNDEDMDSLIDAYNDALVEGDTAKQKELMKSIIGGGRQQTTQAPVVDEDAIIAKVEAKAENKKAWDDFIGSNAAFADETSKQRQYGDYLFDTVYSPQIRAGQISYREALVKTAEEVGKIFTPGQTTREQKEERKRGIDNLPVAVGARAASAKTGIKSHEETIADMRRARGQLA